jgi:hypothetical protein
MRATWVLLIVVAVLAFAHPLVLADTFTFEDLPVGTIVNAQYGPRGVIFFGAYIDSSTYAHSGTHVLRSIPPTAEVFTPAPLVMTFTSPQGHVAFHASNYPGITGRGTLKVFDANGKVLAQDGPKAVPDNSFAAVFDVTAPVPKIVRAEFQIEGVPLEFIDDLVVEGTNVPPPKDTPKVTITSPAEGAVVPAGSLTIRGTVSGQSLLDTMTLRIAIGLPNDSTAPPSNNEIKLAGAGANRTFSLAYGVLTGAYTVTALATNTANLQGSATVHFSSLPPAIVSRYQSSGGAATFGALRFGASEAGCIAAIYDKGLIAEAGNQTFIVQGAIFQKWLATREAGAFMSRLGCPTSEQRAAAGGTKAQDFKHGRIYANGNSAAYVPEVLRDAIETLGGEDTTGIATADPKDSTGAMQTWLFQRFTRPGQPVEPSTLEIRGSPPVLYVERVGDGLDDLERGGLSLAGTTATIVRTFKCSGNLGPCTVTKPGWSPTISDGERYCGGRYPVTTLTEWHWMRSNYFPSPIGGWVKSSQMSCTDNPLTHDYPDTNGSGRCSIQDVFPSDWQVYVQPMAPYGDILTFDQSTLEIEFEAYYARHFFVYLGWPLAGDLIYANGRWIMDCGHSPYKTEIHPPFLMSNMRTHKRTDGTSETVADIWVTGYYPGDPIDLDLWPPPRPTPDAFLTVVRPKDQDAALGVNLQLTTSFAGARVHYTAPHQEVPVDGSGKMNWAPLRAYEGEWQIYWSLH